MVLKCDICGGKLIMGAGGNSTCDSCGLEYTPDRLKEKAQEIKGSVAVSNIASSDSLMMRGNSYLESQEWDKSIEYFDKVLDIEPENSKAHLGKLCSFARVPKVDLLGESKFWAMIMKSNIENISVDSAWNDNKWSSDIGNALKNALRFSDEGTKSKILGYEAKIHEQEQSNIYNWIVQLMDERKKMLIESNIDLSEQFWNEIESLSRKSEYLSIKDKLPMHPQYRHFSSSYSELADKFDCIIKHKDSLKLQSECKRLAKILEEKAIFTENLAPIIDVIYAINIFKEEIKTKLPGMPERYGGAFLFEYDNYKKNYLGRIQYICEAESKLQNHKALLNASDELNTLLQSACYTWLTEWFAMLKEESQNFNKHDFLNISDHDLEYELNDLLNRFMAIGDYKETHKYMSACENALNKLKNSSVVSPYMLSERRSVASNRNMKNIHILLAIIVSVLCAMLFFRGVNTFPEAAMSPLLMLLGAGGFILGICWLVATMRDR